MVVNIHQPSSEIYKLFDCLWLLDRGGYPIYDGNPIEAITYFKQAAKYTDPDISVCSVCGNVNPELILNIIDSKKIDDSGNQTNIRKFTPEEWHAEYLASRPAFSPVEEEALPKNQQKKPSWFKQFLIFLERNIRTKLTNKQYLAITLLEAPLLALIVALLTRYMDGDEYTLLANKNFVSYIFIVSHCCLLYGIEHQCRGDYKGPDDPEARTFPSVEPEQLSDIQDGVSIGCVGAAIAFVHRGGEYHYRSGKRDVRHVVEYSVGNVVPGESDRADPFADDELGCCDLYHDPASVDPTDIALRLGHQV